MNIRLSLLTLSMGLAAIAGAQKGANYIPGEVVVRFKAGSSLQQTAAKTQLGAREAERIPYLDIARIILPKGVSVTQGVDYFKKFSFVAFAEPNYIAKATFTPNDTNWGSQWGPKKIQADLGWDINKGDSNVKIAIIDTGSDKNHADLSGKFVGGWDFVNNDSNAQDDNGHGTHTAGIAAANTNNNRGVAGVGFNCSIMPIKVLSSGGSGSYFNVASGIRYGADNGAKVLSLSLGGGSPDSGMQSAVDYAWGKGSVIIAAAGNDGSTSPFYPAYYTNVIAVASTTSSDSRSSFSNYGSWVDVAAPGSSIYSTWLGGGYTSLDGTSMAAPHVAGLAGLLYSVLGGSATATQVRSLIENNCDNVGNFVNKGRINVFKALKAAAPGSRTFAPWFVQTTRGTYQSGDVNSLLNSDDNYYIVQQRAPFSPADASAQILMSGTADSSSASTLTLRYEASTTASPANKILVKVEMFNYSTSTWETVDQRAATAGDSVVDIVINSNASRFIDPAAFDMQARIGWVNQGAVSLNWVTKTDQVKWTLQ